MASAIVNPDELREFSSYLAKVAGQLSELKAKTGMRMSHLNQTWKDQENAKFTERFVQDIKQVEKLIETANEYSKFLSKKAQSLDAYFNTKM